MTDSDELLARFLSLCPEPCCLAGFDGRFREINAAWEKTLGYSREELLARPYTELPHPCDLPALQGLRGRLESSGGAPVTLEVRCGCKDGSFRVLSWRCALSAQSDVFLAVAPDLTALRRSEALRAGAERKLRESESLAHIGNWSWDPHEDKAEWSPELYSIMARPPELPALTFSELLELFTPEGRARIQEAGSRTLATGEPYREELEMRRCDGKTVWVLACGRAEKDETGRVVRMSGTTQDICERKAIEQEKSALEARLQRAQTLETIGRLAGGVAHDFNNVLSTICGHAEFMQLSLEPGDPGYEDLTGILEAVGSGTALTRQLLALTNRGAGPETVMDPDSAIKGIRLTLSRLLGDNYELDLRTGLNGWRIKADRHRIEQVVMNLALNARDAMPGGGRVIIETREQELRRELPSAQGPVPAGHYVLLTVSDSGCGMDEATISRIFEPFFTTKDDGKGTGLGLSIVRDITRAAGGRIIVKSAPGSGTAFYLYFPVAETEALEEETPSGEAHAAPCPGGTENLLLVEDDRLLRRITARSLRAAGYNVYEAINGREALDLHRLMGGRIALTITDLAMPKLDGAGLIKELKAVSPGMKFLLTTACEGGPPPEAAAPLLLKPLRRKALLKAVRSALDS
jgi:PAS domain S-box-containing protein